MQESGIASWRRELPVLSAQLVALREPTFDDTGALAALLSLDDASRFGMEDSVNEAAVHLFVERATRDRESGASFTYVVEHGPLKVAGLVQVRALDPAFETAEWECTLAPSARGTGAFIEMARLVCGFAFNAIGAHRLEARVQLQNGRANGALRKLGAVQEGILRRSARRRDTYVDQVLWSVLKDDWGDQWIVPTPRVH